MRKFIHIMAIIAAFAATGCSAERAAQRAEKKAPEDLISFTGNLVEKYALTSEQINALQFYSSTEIVLERDLSEEAATVEEGKLIIGPTADRIVITKNLPGITSEKSTIREVHIMYSEQVEFIFIRDPNNPEQRYTIAFPGGKAEVMLGEKMFSVKSGTNACLMISKKDLGRVITNYLPGVKK